MTKKLLLATAILGANFLYAEHWGYIGAGAPEHWAKINKKSFMCAEGQNQSPINLTSFIEAKLPVLITCTHNLNEPRYPTLQGIDESFNKEIKKWTAKDVNAVEDKVGINASPTNVKKTFKPAAKGQGTMLKGSIKDMAHELIEKLKEKEIISNF